MVYSSFIAALPRQEPIISFVYLGQQFVNLVVKMRYAANFC